MKIQSRFILSLIGMMVLLFTNKLLAHTSDSLYFPTPLITQNNIEANIGQDYRTIQQIISPLTNMQGQVSEIYYILENYKKVENLWGFYEEAKRDGKNLNNSPLIKELTYLSKYTLFLIDESLDKILGRLNSEPLRLALVEWKSRKLSESQQIYQADKKDLERLAKMKPSVMENPTISNTKKLATLLYRRDSLYQTKNGTKVLGEFRRNQSKPIEEVDLFYNCDPKKRIADNAPQSIMDFTSNKAIEVIRLDREIYQFRLVALASLPYKEQQYFKFKKQLAVAASKEQQNSKRKFLKKKTDPTSHHSLILKDYNKLVDSFSFEEQSKLREKEPIFNHPVISEIEFWGCPAYFPGFYEK